VKKRMLLIKASNDVCGTEIAHLEKICEMFDIAHSVVELFNFESFYEGVKPLGKFDYVYLGAHANQYGFGDAHSDEWLGWGAFAAALCSTDCLRTESVLLLGCCRGGLRSVAMTMFVACGKIDYVLGPRWTVTAQDITTGFHVFLYNLTIRREQPSTGAKRASSATGYDFYYYDRVEVEDSANSEELMSKVLTTMMADVDDLEVEQVHPSPE
jgi:hypothetical protein